MHFTAEHEVADKVEISRLVLVYIGLCWTLNLISLSGIITLTKLYGKRWNPIDETNQSIVNLKEIDIWHYRMCLIVSVAERCS